jgi:proteic killer suppression protein
MIVSFRDDWLRDFFLEDVRTKNIPSDLYRESLRIRKIACRASIFGFGLAA